MCNYGGESFTFGEVATLIEKFHIVFEKAGVKKGDKITLCARNTARWGVSFLAINTYEAVVVPLLNEFTPDAVTSLVNHSESVFLFTDPELWAKLDIKNLPNIKAVVNNNDYTLLYCRDRGVSEAYGELNVIFESKYPMGYSRENVNFTVDNLQNLAVINYTSGTTSAPKGVMLRYECFSATLQFCIENVLCDNSDSIVSMLPMGHIYGLMFEFLYPTCLGAKVYFLGKTPSPSLLLRAMKDVKPFLVVTVPLVMEKIYKSSILPQVSKWYMAILLHIPFVDGAIYRKIGDKLQEAFGGNVRQFIMGGAALNPAAEKMFRRIGLPYTVGYGMTEASPLLAYDQPQNYVPGSCGQAVTCAQVRIDSEDPQHIAGEIQAKGANICSGYFNNPEASENAFTDDGFLRTGDLGIMDRNGKIFIKGRSKTMILSANGQNIYPEELEATINANDYVAESLVVDRNGKLVALIYLDQDAINKAGLDDESVADIPEIVRVSSNRTFPIYSKLAKVEVVTVPFEKTPKMSIKRFLYK